MNQNRALDPREALQPSDIVASFLNNAPVPVDQIAVALGLRLSFAPLAEVSGKIERDTIGYKMTVNSSDPHVRQRFTIAHEIGHFVLHRDLIGDGLTDDAMYRSKLSSEFETQANQYAAYVLMPPALVREKWRAGAKSYAELARIFDVSQEAAEYRLKKLDRLL